MPLRGLAPAHFNEARFPFALKQLSQATLEAGTVLLVLLHAALAGWDVGAALRDLLHASRAGGSLGSAASVCIVSKRLDPALALA